MALVVEDGTGRADAESYISVNDADTYHSDRGNSTWGPLATSAKEQHLRKATDYMLEAYRGRWLSFRVFSTQTLDWPRAYVALADAPSGYGSFAAFVPNNIVPTEVKRACAELALASMDGALSPALDRTTRREKVGEIEVEYDAGSPAYKQFRSVDMLLSVYLAGSGSSAGLVRA